MLTRFAPSDLEIRSDGRTVHGVLVPFDSQTEISEAGGGYVEQFARGAFAELTANPAQVGRVKLLSQHQRQANPLGRAVELVEDSVGLVGAFRLSKTAAADEALELVRDGALDSFSIGFEPAKGGSDWNRTRTEVVRRRAHLREASLVNFPAYVGARVVGVRTLAFPFDERARDRDRVRLRQLLGDL